LRSAQDASPVAAQMQAEVRAVTKAATGSHTHVLDFPVSSRPDDRWLDEDLCGPTRGVERSGIDVAAPDGKPFSLTFRTDVPKDFVKQCNWFPPVLKRID
jgi:hypothetical protein